MIVFSYAPMYFTNDEEFSGNQSELKAIISALENDDMNTLEKIVRYKPKINYFIICYVKLLGHDSLATTLYKRLNYDTINFQGAMDTGDYQLVKLLISGGEKYDISHYTTALMYGYYDIAKLLSTNLMNTDDVIYTTLRFGNYDMIRHIYSRYKTTFPIQSAYPIIFFHDEQFLEHYYRRIVCYNDNENKLFNKIRPWFKNRILEIQNNRKNELIDIFTFCIDNGLPLSSTYTIDTWDPITHRNNAIDTLQTPLFLAVINNCPKVVEYIIKKKSDNLNDVDYLGNTIANYAFKNYNKNIINILLHTNISLEKPNNFGVTPFMHAVDNEDIEMVQQLIAKGINVNFQNIKGQTALMNAAWNGNFEIVDLLIENGASINLSNKTGWTALMCAVYKGNKEITSYLIKNGADIHIKNKWGNDCKMIALRSNDIELIDILTQEAK